VSEVPSAASISRRNQKDSVHRTAAQVANTWLGDHAARVGLAARSVVYVIFGYLVARIALGALGDPGTSEHADVPGVAQALASQTGGAIIVFLLGLGLLLFAGFSALDAILHHEHEHPDAKRWFDQAISVWTMLVYAGFGGYCLVTAIGNTATSAQQSDQRPVEWSARVLRWPLGVVWLFLLGAILAVTAVVLLAQAVRQSFRGQLNERRLRGLPRPIMLTLGTVGYVGRAALFGIVAFFVLKATFTEDPNHGEGVDGSVRILAASTAGPALLWVLALTLCCYGVYLGMEGRYRRV
jgi:hypothetical protein